MSIVATSVLRPVIRSSCALSRSHPRFTLPSVLGLSIRAPNPALAPSALHPSGSLVYFSTRPVARKGRGGNVPGETGDTVSGAPLTFANQAKHCFVDIYDAVQDMKTLNETFDITLTETELKIDVGLKGKFVFTIKPRGETLQYHSPVSGVLEYKFDPEERLWLQVDDRHDFRGMLTRDMLRVCIGYPKFK